MKTAKVFVAVFVALLSLTCNGRVSSWADGEAELKTYFGVGLLGNVAERTREAKFAMPAGVCLDPGGRLIVFDTYNASIKVIRNNLSAAISGFPGMRDGYGFAKAGYLDSEKETALWGRPMGGVYTSDNDLFVVDSENNAIRRIHRNTVSTFAGGNRGFADGVGNAAKFRSPAAITADEDGNLYVADTGNHCIRKVTPSGTVTTIAGTPENAGFSDGSAGKALFYEPSGIAVDENGAVYVADTGNHVIRKIDGGVVTTIAGSIDYWKTGQDYKAGGYADGPAARARFSFPRGLCYAEGVLFIADTGNHMVRAISKEGIVSTLAGNGDVGNKDGSLHVSMMNKPAYGDGVLYIADSFNNKIKTISVDLQSLQS